MLQMKPILQFMGGKPSDVAAWYSHNVNACLFVLTLRANSYLVSLYCSL